jgi:serine/threonine protein kinase
MPKAGKYHIARKIADGGMAEIFVGTQHGMEGFERPVVLKRILAPLVADPQFRNMLIDEAHVAMGLNHSNIVQVLDLGHVRGRYFLVLELVDGWDLSQILARATSAQFPLPPEIVLYITAEICRALAYAHARERDGQPLAIVHRDVSPQNVLVSEQGEVKLTDFGIAKAMGRRERTNQGVIKGKLAFMSPEQASGWVLDNRSDLFALGTMLYLIFTDRRPFEAPTDLESIMRVRECKFTPPEEVKPSLNPELVKIIHRAMQALPANRYQSADEMLMDIESVQRTAYKPAGQTELKRWLSELQQRDNCPTISHATSAEPVSAEDEALDIGAGAEVVFDDESNMIQIEDVLSGMQATVAATPKQIALPPPLPPREDKTKAEVPVSPKSSRIPTRIIVLSLLAAAITVGVWLVLPGDNRAPAKRGHEPPAKRAVAVPPEVAKPEGTPAPVVVIDAGTKAPAEMAKPAQPPGTPPTAASAESEEEEENLLKNAEPDDHERVIDEDEGVKSGKKKTAAVPSKPSAEPVSVHVVSTPEGAVVSLGKRVFGRAPMNLRFRPGITFELTLVKKGYLPATKRFTATGKVKQTVRVALKKKPATSPTPRKSLFRRIFGGR